MPQLTLDGVDTSKASFSRVLALLREIEVFETSTYTTSGS